jgi:hypothetical protein
VAYADELHYCYEQKIDFELLKRNVLIKWLQIENLLFSLLMSC